MRGRIGRRFPGIGGPSNFDAVCVEHHCPDRDVCVGGGTCGHDGRTDHALVVSESHLARELVERCAELGCEPESLRDHPQLLVRIEIGLGRDDGEHGFRQAQIGQHGQITLFPGFDIVEVVRSMSGISMCKASRTSAAMS